MTKLNREKLFTGVTRDKTKAMTQSERVEDGPEVDNRRPWHAGTMVTGQNTISTMHLFIPTVIFVMKVQDNTFIVTPARLFAP